VGRAWLGRDEETGLRIPRGRDDDPRLNAWTDAPRHYGLHATLKPPFRLRPGATASGLDGKLRELARAQAPFGIALTLRELRGFLAWRLTEDAASHARIRFLADSMVRDLDAYRAPPVQADIARRHPEQLDPLQRRMLAQWGYPYVFDAFTFHITLTGKLDTAELDHARDLLHARAARKLDGAMPVEAVSVYVQPRPGDAFIVARHYGFDGTTRDAAGAPCMDDDTP
jgi:hypothetical protein